VEAKEQHEKVYIERAKAKSIKNKVTASFTVGCMDSYQDKARNKDDEGAGPSDDSMMMDIEAGGGGSDFEVLESDELPPPPKTTARGKKASTKAPAKAPAKKAPAKGRGKKAVQVRMSAMDPAVSSSSNLD
jgi:double-strand break repair protein MRE11